MKTQRILAVVVIAATAVVLLLLSIKHRSADAAASEEVSPVDAGKTFRSATPVSSGPAGPARESAEQRKGNGAAKNKLVQWSEDRERSLTNAAFQSWVREYMIGRAGAIVSNLPIYGLSSPLETNGLTVAGQIWGDDPQFTLVTSNHTRFAFDLGAIRKVEALAVLPSGAFDPGLSEAERAKALSALDWVPDKHWSDEEVRAAFDSVARYFGLTASDLQQAPKFERTAAQRKKAMQPLNGPPVPQPASGGGDAFIEGRLADRTDPSSSLFVVKFRTEKAPDGTYRLAVVEIINHNFAERDPAASVSTLKRFF